MQNEKLGPAVYLTQSGCSVDSCQDKLVSNLAHGAIVGMARTNRWVSAVMHCGVSVMKCSCCVGLRMKPAQMSSHLVPNSDESGHSKNRSTPGRKWFS